LMEFSVLFRVKSNMKSMATASLQTSGNMFTNSRWPPRSQIENVISVFLIEIVFSIKLTPVAVSKVAVELQMFRTKCLNVIFVPAALNVFHHQTSLANLRISDHADLNNDAGILVCRLWWSLLLLLRAPALILV
jgi:hypothetical protein